VLEFATSKFGVTFPMFSKIEVNGDGACELYQWLREQTEGADIGWNFEKFLIGRDGEVVQRFNPMVTPEEIAPHVAELL
jgi:glutathione peroxidase